ncbi:MAG: ADP-ribosylglycohydrolase family protein [Thermoguttaceae bacterium]
MGEYSVNGRCFDIGVTTQSALRCFEKTGNARTSGDPSVRASGNGSIMRLAPVPICHFLPLFRRHAHGPDDETASNVTHALVQRFKLPAIGGEHSSGPAPGPRRGRPRRSTPR